MSEKPKQWHTPAPTERELLARLDERTEKLDRDVRQVLNGMRSHSEEMERRVERVETAIRDEVASLRAVVNHADALSKEALDMAKRHDEWITWTVRIVLGAVLTALLGLVLVSGLP